LRCLFEAQKGRGQKAGSFERDTINEEDLHTEEVLTDRTHYPSTERPFVILQINDRTDELPARWRTNWKRHAPLRGQTVE
jgi:hypothetical protein